MKNWGDQTSCQKLLPCFFVFLFLVCESISIRNLHPLTELFQSSWTWTLANDIQFSHFFFISSLFLCVVFHFYFTRFPSRLDAEPRINSDVEFHRCSQSFVLLSWDYTNLTLHKFMIIRVSFVIVNCDVRAPNNINCRRRALVIPHWAVNCSMEYTIVIVIFF